MIRTRLATVRDTERLGARLARSCPWEQPGPRVLGLQGELGAGKTTLAGGLLRALGVRETVRSPSYTLIEIYTADVHRAVHADLYRLHGAEELEAIGLRDELGDDTLVLIEWPERAGRALPPLDLRVQLAYAPGAQTGRTAWLEALSGAGEAWLDAMDHGGAGRPKEARRRGT